VRDLFAITKFASTVDNASGDTTMSPLQLWSDAKAGNYLHPHKGVFNPQSFQDTLKIRPRYGVSKHLHPLDLELH